MLESLVIFCRMMQMYLRQSVLLFIKNDIKNYYPLTRCKLNLFYILQTKLIKVLFFNTIYDDKDIRVHKIYEIIF